MYDLYIANKNYSSWSLRPWLLMRELGIPFSERLLPFGRHDLWKAFRELSTAGKVPCLVDQGGIVWESLAIVEYLAERHAKVWPADPAARAWARSAAAEMHAGFSELRSRCSMSCGVRIRLHEITPALQADLARIGVLWNDGLRRFGGSFLAGREFSGVDAFFAPVAFRIQSYGLKLDAACAAYAQRLLDLPAMREWYAAGLKETFRDEPHEIEILQEGTLLEDLRAA
jgi:glutathione S-transferase